MKTIILRGVKPCSIIEVNLCFGGTSVKFYQTTRRHIPLFFSCLSPFDYFLLVSLFDTEDGDCTLLRNVSKLNMAPYP
jgi:hypothetical protein